MQAETKKKMREDRDLNLKLFLVQQRNLCDFNSTLLSAELVN